ncbi:Nucleic-acid-binding protein from transposon X-element [Eumeta japonica]|uniref:Nucleic-acid-binding protein from transposon X-element n=1 Tax=Eumeta variegata TaxID=151549 RepID=A0A4C1YLU7_EUMVA|nr:Nucleic-acid-binding protein from transposon X-element [Eumeta japonica]
MEVDATQATAAPPAPKPKSSPAQVPATTSSQMEADRATAPAQAGSKPGPLGSKCLHILRKGANFIQISAACTRLRINYSKAVRTADDGIKITCSDVETFRSLNKYLVDFKVQFHTHALEEERKIKVVIRVHRLCHRDGTPLWLVLAVLPRTEEAKNLSRTLNKVCGLSGIRVEAPHKKGGPGQCHRCQLYGHASANCNANPRCVKCLVHHWTRDCPLTRFGGKTSCVNCGQNHTANYRGCPKATKFISKNRPNTKRPSYAPSPSRDLVNFPALASKKTTPVVNFHPAPAPPPIRGQKRERSNRRAPPRGRLGKLNVPPGPPPASAIAGSSSFGEDIQTVMAVLRAVSSLEISEFAAQLRACRNTEEKLLVLVRYHHLMVRLESI